MTSGPKELVWQWHQAALDRIIPGIGLFRPDEITLDWIEEAFNRGELAVFGEIRSAARSSDQFNPTDYKAVRLKKSSMIIDSKSFHN